MQHQNIPQLKQQCLKKVFVYCSLYFNQPLRPSIMCSIESRAIVHHVNHMITYRTERYAPNCIYL